MTCLNLKYATNSILMKLGQLAQSHTIQTGLLYVNSNWYTPTFNQVVPESETSYTA